MYAESIASWLKRKSRLEAAFDVLVCLVLLTCTLAILGLTWGLGYVISLLLQQTFGSFAQEILRTDLPHFRLIDWAFASGFLLILFAAHMRREREAAGEDPRQQITGGRDSFFPWAIRMSVDTAGDAAGRITSDFVLIGPRLSFFTYTIFHRAVRLSQMDYRRCAQILEALVRRGRRMSFVELEKVVPDANRFHVFDQLRDIDGVVFLLSEPAGISLVQDLRTELRNLPMPTVTNAPPPPPRPQSSARAEFRPPEAPPAVEVPKELEECYYILGISTNATEVQVRDAYRKKIKECHPDRFNRFGKDWQKLAEDRSKQVNVAYERIISRF